MRLEVTVAKLLVAFSTFRTPSALVLRQDSGSVIDHCQLFFLAVWLELDAWCLVFSQGIWRSGYVRPNFAAEAQRGHSDAARRWLEDALKAGSSCELGEATDGNRDQ